MSPSIHRRPTFLRLTAATLIGSIVGTATLVAMSAATGNAEWDMLMSPEQSFGSALTLIYIGVLLLGVVPTLFIGSILIGLKRGTALRLVLAPAILFLLVLARIGDARLATIVLPALVVGGATTLWLLATAKPAPEPVHLVFE